MALVARQDVAACRAAGARAHRTSGRLVSPHRPKITSTPCALSISTTASAPRQRGRRSFDRLVHAAILPRRATPSPYWLRTVDADPSPGARQNAGLNHGRCSCPRSPARAILRKMPADSSGASRRRARWLRDQLGRFVGSTPASVGMAPASQGRTPSPPGICLDHLAHFVPDLALRRLKSASRHAGSASRASPRNLEPLRDARGRLHRDPRPRSTRRCARVRT